MPAETCQDLLKQEAEKGGTALFERARKSPTEPGYSCDSQDVISLKCGLMSQRLMTGLMSQMIPLS